MLCIPLLNQGVAGGVLYLESSQAAGVFTPERVMMLELIAAQGAASLENVRLALLLAQEKASRREADAAREKSEAAAPEVIMPLDKA